MARSCRGWCAAGLVTGLIAVLASLVPGAPAAAQEPPTEPGDAELELAERYAPIVVVRTQEEACDTDGEPFEPAPVDIVLDNPEILLRQVGNGDPVAMLGPGSSDLFDLREGWYLDFPGDALEPGCIFEQDFHRFYDGQSLVYAHIATEADRPGFIAVQYWLFWYHNPAKNDHEGDWEFVQVLFEADTADEALASTPVGVGYAQHTGGERAGWDDDDLEREGDRPVVYAAKGSHASYFGSALYLGRSSREGFGCDNTTGPSRRLDPEVSLLPDEVTDRDDPLAWLSFQGRWGQREAGFFNGPTGPYAKARWTEPVSWYENLRTSSVVIPAGDRFGDQVVRGFCGAVEVGSNALTRTLRSPALAVVIGALMIFAVVSLVRSTRWSPVTVAPLRADRAVGQILRASWRVWLRSPREMLLIGSVFVPVAIVTSMLQAGVLAIPLVDDVVDLAGDRSGIAFVLAIAVGGIAELLAFAFVTAAVARVIDERVRTDERMLPSGEELRRLVAAVARGTVIVVALLVSTVGIPWAIRQLVRYQFAPQAVVLEGEEARGAMARSTELVRGRWWWTAAVVLGVEVAILAAGFGAAVAVLLLVRSLPLWAFNLVSSLIYIVLVPVGASAVTYAYGTLAASSQAAEPVLAERRPAVTGP
jgi:hypothetical protein